MRDTTLDLIGNCRFSPRALAFFKSHYHLILDFENTDCPHRVFIAHLHRELSLRLNPTDAAPGRKVMYQFWDTELTFEKSYLARINYVHQNAVHHRLVAIASQYPWCSARWFELKARPAFVSTVYSFKTDRLNVADEF